MFYSTLNAFYGQVNHRINLRFVWEFGKIMYENSFMNWTPQVIEPRNKVGFLSGLFELPLCIHAFSHFALAKELVKYNRVKGELFYQGIGFN